MLGPVLVAKQGGLVGGFYHPADERRRRGGRDGHRLRRKATSASDHRFYLSLYLSISLLSFLIQ